MLFKGCYVASMNCVKVRYVPFIFIGLKMEGDRRGIRVSLIRVITVDDSGGVFKEVALNRFALSTFAIGDSVEDCVSLCRLILEFEDHSTW